MKFINRATDVWQDRVDTEEAPAAAPHLILSYPQWERVRAFWPRDFALGLRLPNTFDVELLAQELPRLTLIALQFPKWVDGRAYSQAHTLRARLRFTGELRATADVIVDMVPLLKRTGFDAVELREGQRQSSAERALTFFSTHYQGDVLQPLPLFARERA